MTTATTSAEGEIVLSGDLCGTATFPQLVSTGVIPGTYSPVQTMFVDAKGRIVSVGQLALSDISSIVGNATTTTKGVYSIGNRMSVVSGALSVSQPTASDTTKGIFAVSNSGPSDLWLSLTGTSVSLDQIASTSAFGKLKIGTGLSVSSGIVSVDGALSLTSGSAAPFTFSAALSFLQTSFAVTSPTAVSGIINVSAMLTSDRAQISDSSLNTAAITLQTAPSVLWFETSTSTLHGVIGGSTGIYPKYTYSTDNGLTWSTGVALSSTTADQNAFPISIRKLGSTVVVLMQSANSSNQHSVFTSTDSGATWTGYSLPNTTAGGIVYFGFDIGNSLFCATGFSSSTNRCATSPDGITWTSRTIPNATSAYTQMGGVIWVNSRFVISGANGTFYPCVSSSTDGTTWTSSVVVASALGYPSIGLIAYGAGLYILPCGGGSGSARLVKTSPDLTTWTDRTVSGTYTNGIISRDVMFNGSIFYISGYTNPGTVYLYATSTDGISWTLVSSNISAYGGGTGYNWPFAVSTTYFWAHSYYRSADGITWVSPQSGISTWPVKVNFTTPSSNVGQSLKAIVHATRDVQVAFDSNVLVAAGTTLTVSANKSMIMNLVGDGNSKWLLSTDTNF